MRVEASHGRAGHRPHLAGAGGGENLGKNMIDALKFWDWFKTQAPRIAAAGLPTPDDILDDVLEHLHAYCSGLYFEMGGPPDQAAMELVITAEGNVEHFSAVRALVAAAPVIDGWTVVAFKPPMGFEFSIETRDVTVDPAECWVLPFVSDGDPREFGLRIALPGYKKRKNDEIVWACCCCRRPWEKSAPRSRFSMSKRARCPRIRPVRGSCRCRRSTSTCEGVPVPTSTERDSMHIVDCLLGGGGWRT